MLGAGQSVNRVASQTWRSTTVSMIESRNYSRLRNPQNRVASTGRQKNTGCSPTCASIQRNFARLPEKQPAVLLETSMLARVCLAMTVSLRTSVHRENSARLQSQQYTVRLHNVVTMDEFRVGRQSLSVFARFFKTQSLGVFRVTPQQ
jgi:hypothetical protein